MWRETEGQAAIQVTPKAHRRAAMWQARVSSGSHGNLHPFSVQALELLSQRAASLQACSLPDLKPPPEAEYALLRLRSFYAAPQSSGVVAQLPAAVDIFIGGAEKLLVGDPAARRSQDARLLQLTRQLFPGGAPALDSDTFASAVSALAKSEISRLQASLQRGAQQVQLLDELMVSLAGRPSDQARTRRSKERLKQRMQPELNSLLRWLAGGYAGFELLPAAMQDGAGAASHAEEWSVGATSSRCMPAGHGCWAACWHAG